MKTSCSSQVSLLPSESDRSSIAGCAGAGCEDVSVSIRLDRRRRRQHEQQSASRRVTERLVLAFGKSCANSMLVDLSMFPMASVRLVKHSQGKCSMMEQSDRQLPSALLEEFLMIFQSMSAGPNFLYTIRMKGGLCILSRAIVLKFHTLVSH